MSNTVTNISYANTFGEWVVATNALINENNVLGSGDYTKASGTLYLNETTQNSLQANGTVIVQKELRVQGTGSSATIDRNMTVGGQVYFTNSTLGLTHTGQANLNGLVLVQGPGIGISVSNTAYIGGNTTIRFNTFTNTVQANTSVNTAVASVTGITYTDKLQSNTSVNTAVASVTGTTFTDILIANTSLYTPLVQAYQTVNTSIISATNKLFVKDIQANNSIVGSSFYANTIVSNTSATLLNADVTGIINVENALIKTLTVQGGSGLIVNGNFTLTGQTVYSSNTFVLSDGVSSAITSYLNIDRGSSGVDASFRWNESKKYWETLNVTSNTYYRVVTDEFLNESASLYANSAFIKSNSAYDSQNTSGLYANSAFLQSNSSYAQANSASLYANGAFIQANSAYGSQNTTGTYANSSYAQANSASLYANGAFIQANAAYTSQNTTGTYANSAYARANTSANTFVGTTGSVTHSGGVISFSSNNGITIVATSANNFAISDPQDLRTTASPTFASLSLTAPLALSQGGTGATSAASALTNILPTGTTAGYVLTTGGPGNFYWATAGGGGSGVTPGTTINSTRLSYTGNGAPGYTGNSFIIPTATQSTQVRAYIDGVRQFESEYTLNLGANTIAFTTTPDNGSKILVEVDGYYVNPYYANNITFTAPFGGIISSANTIQLAIQDLETRKAALAGDTFTGVVTGVTVNTNASNTAFATTSFVKNALNNSNTYTHSISGSAGSVANTGVTGVMTASQLSNTILYGIQTSADNITAGTLAAARLGTTSNVQFFSIGVNTAPDSANIGTIRATGTITAGYSDDNLKTKLGSIENPLDKVMSLNGFYYEPNQTAQNLGYEIKKDVGLSAQEVQKVLPEIVASAPINGNYLTIHYEKMVPLLVEAIKELKQEIEILKGNKQ